MPDAASLVFNRPVPLYDTGSIWPDVAAAEGAAWAVWVQQDAEAGERVLARAVGGEALGPVLEVSARPGIVLQPCITALHDPGCYRIAWVAEREGRWHLLARDLRDGRLGDEVVIATNPEGVFRPRAAVDTTGTYWVACEWVEGPRTCIAVAWSRDGRWDVHVGARADEDAFRPDLCIGPGGAVWLAYDCYDRARCSSRIELAPVEPSATSPTPPVVVAHSGYRNVQPALASDGAGGLWIAFASNRNDARQDPAWLTKWSYVVHYDGVTLREPAGRRPDVDLYNEHAYQGWEFPAIAGSAGGGFVLVGQSAHSVLGQAYAGVEWTPAHTLCDRRWGSWKPQCRLAGAGPHVLVSMGLGGAQVQRIDVVGPAGSPGLVPAVAPASARRPRVEARARPTLLGPDGTAYRVYFGDLHGHSVYSDAVGDVDEFYHRYRDLYGYDFAALTEHDVLDGIELSRSELRMMWNHADRLTADGDFLAWYAYEWTSPAIGVHAADGAPVGEGHRHVLYPDPDGPLISYGRKAYRTGADLLAALRGRRAIVIPHHTSWSGTDWDAHDPDLQPVVEVVSTHGRFEYAGNRPIGYRRDHTHQGKSVLDALARGHRLGFVGGSDSHGLRWHALELEGRAAHIPHGTRVGYKEDAYRTGMTAVLAESLDREALFEAVRARRCYATSGVPICLDFRVDGALMGSEISVCSQPVMTGEVRGTAALRSVEVIRSGHVLAGVHAQPGEGLRRMQIEVEDTLLIPGEETFYYLRVVQEDGNMAWSSPIWVHFRAASSGD